MKKFNDPFISDDKDASYYFIADTIKSRQPLMFFGSNQAGQKINLDCSMYLIAFKDINPDQISNNINHPITKDSAKVLVSGGSSWFDKETRQNHLNWLTNKPNGVRLDISEKKLDTIKDFKCFQGNFQQADLSGKPFIDVCFSFSNLNYVEFTKARLTNVNFFNSHLENAFFNKDIIENCSFMGSDLKGAIFTKVKFKNVDFSCANMAGVIFEPDSVPNVQDIAFANNLDSLTYQSDPSALIKLKELLKASGFSEAQRKVTAAIQRRKQNLNTSKIVKFLNYILFDFTSSFGLKPWRPLVLLLALIYIFYRIYLFLFFINQLRIQIKHQYENRVGKTTTVNDPIQPGRLLFLSIITSFSIGFGNYNINEWAKKLLKEDYVLQPSGWTRVLTGVQYLLSLYLFFLTILLLFGDPFSF